MRRAKIVCTLGPATDDPKILARLIDAGMDVARFNFSHGTHEEHARRFEQVRTLARKAGRTVAVLQDVQGPKIRLGAFEGGAMTVADGDAVTLTTRPVLGKDGVIPTPIQTLPRDVKKGDPILLDDGKVRLEVTRVKGSEVFCRVIRGGVLKDKKGLNLPGSPLSVSTLTGKDRRDLKFGQTLGVDFVALSFVRTAADVHEARRLVTLLKTPLIAKIEKPQAVENLAEIADAADGVMIARGDLGVELPLAKLPAIQKAAVRAVNRKGKLVIVATEMMESMIHNPRPTRAEVSDVANAVLDGADAVMLSGETAAGRFPVETVRYMAEVVSEVEAQLPARLEPPFERSEDISTGVAAAAVAASRQLHIPLIVAYTESGYTARLVSEFRPEARILGFTPNEQTVNRMALLWGVEPHRVERVSGMEAVIDQVRRTAHRTGAARKGGHAIIVCGAPLNHPGTTNLLTIQTL